MRHKVIAFDELACQHYFKEPSWTFSESTNDEHDVVFKACIIQEVAGVCEFDCIDALAQGESVSVLGKSVAKTLARIGGILHQFGLCLRGPKPDELVSIRQAMKSRFV